MTKGGFSIHGMSTIVVTTPDILNARHGLKLRKRWYDNVIKDVNDYLDINSWEFGLTGIFGLGLFDEAHLIKERCWDASLEKCAKSKN